MGDRRRADSRDRDGDRRGGGGPRHHGGSRGGKGGGRKGADHEPRQLEEHDGIVKVWIGGLPTDVTERELEKLCGKFGRVHGVSLRQSDRDTYAFIDFGRLSDAKTAIADLDQSDPFKNGRIKVAPASRKPPSAGGGKPGDVHAGGGGRSRTWQDTRDRGRDRDGRDRDDRGGGRGGGARSSSRRRKPSEPPSRRRKRSQTPRRSASAPRRRSPSPAPRAPSSPRKRPAQRPEPSKQPKRSRTPPPLPRQPRPAEQQRPSREEPWKVWVSYLPADMEAAEFRDIVSEYGAVANCSFDSRPSSSFNIGWVEYRARRDADAAVLDLDERRIEGWGLRLKARISAGRLGAGRADGGGGAQR